jgi:hypothetical protein
LAEEDAANLRQENAVAIHDDISPAILVMSGLEIESQQSVFILWYLYGNANNCFHSQNPAQIRQRQARQLRNNASARKDAGAQELVASED